MKYIVMECHQAYAVLMDEESRFVHSANLHYKVGQVVTDPVIMESSEPSSRNIRMIVTAAAAACLVLFAGSGYNYYAKNFKTHSTIVISTEANITMEINSKGKVLSLKSDSESGRELLKNYSGKGKDKKTVASEIIELEKSKGLLSEGDRVDFYVSSTDPDYTSSLQQEMNDIKAKLDEPSVKPHENEDKPAVKEPEIKHPAASETAPPAPSAPKKAEEKVVEPPKAEPVKPADPPAPVAPKEEHPPVEKAEDTPAPEPPAPAEVPAPPEAPAEPEKPVHEKHDPPTPEPNNSNENHDQNKVIHKSQEKLPDTVVPPHEAAGNEMTSSELVVPDSLIE